MKEECYDVDLYEWTKVDVNDPVSSPAIPINCMVHALDCLVNAVILYENLA